MYCTRVPFHETGSAREQRVQPRVVEALADVPPSREEEPLLVRRDRGELRAHGPFAFAHPALEHDQVPRDAREPAREVLEVVLALREEDRRPRPPRARG